MLRIGLTGGIASGKSTVADMFSALGAGVIDTDALAREIVEPGSKALANIRKTFGAGVIRTDGTLDRSGLRQIVFSEPERRLELEAILHPPIRALALERAAVSTAPYVLLAVPLLFETGFDELVDRNLVVDCPVEDQLSRLQDRDGISESEARRIISAQMDRDDRLAAADDVIDNSGDIEATRTQVMQLHQQYLRAA